jgi:hypothetical protein
MAGLDPVIYELPRGASRSVDAGTRPGMTIELTLDHLE